MIDRNISCTIVLYSLLFLNLLMFQLGFTIYVYLVRIRNWKTHATPELIGNLSEAHSVIESKSLNFLFRCLVVKSEL